VIEPVLSDEAFLADVAAARGEPGPHLWWLGQSGFLLQHRRGHLLFDPYLSDSLTAKYAGTDKPHVRMTRRVVPPDRLDFVDVITSTHNHTDHLDADTVAPIARAVWTTQLVPPCLVLPAANEAFAKQRLSAPDSPTFVPMCAWEREELPGFTITAVPAAHDRLTTDEQGRHVYLGYVVKAGSWAVYHSGDTVVFDGMADGLRPYEIDVAILPINGKVGNMSGVDAARLAKEIGAKLVIPCHYEMFEFNTASPAEFVAECERLGQPYKVLRAGERWSGGEG
jgi:L-ascorbate metabolism protein UlaG (beta-lactamase superfamily)